MDMYNKFLFIIPVDTNVLKAMDGAKKPVMTIDRSIDRKTLRTFLIKKDNKTGVFSYNGRRYPSIVMIKRR